MIKILILCILITISFAQNEQNDIQFNYNETDKVLTITGNGELEQIDDYYKHKEVKEVIIQNGITQISNGVFMNWKMNKITIGSTIKSIGMFAFANCEQLENIIFEQNSQLESIGDFAFRDCVKLKEITLPKSLKSINFDKAFKGCYSLERIDIEEGGEYYSENNLIYSKDRTKLIYSHERKSLKTFEIKDEIIEINESLFEGSSIKSIIFSSNIKEIKEKAFYINTNITSLFIPENIEVIEKLAFAGSVNLERVVIVCIFQFMNTPFCISVIPFSMITSVASSLYL